MLGNYSRGPNTWASVGAWTVFGTVGCIIVAVVFNAAFFGDMGNTALRRSIVSSVVLPILLGMPLFYYFSMRVRKLAIMNRYLGLIARTDSLTSCLNRGAFTTRISQELSRLKPGANGALLMVDADHFKSINDRFGHESGDEALVLIARSLRAALRPGDVLGRMGGEEFGVYLPGVDQQQAGDIAERLCASVHKMVFMPGGVAHALSVSVGGVVFSGPATFAELFRIADHRLYGAKQDGRNCANVVLYDERQPTILRLRA